MTVRKILRSQGLASRSTPEIYLLAAGSYAKAFIFLGRGVGKTR